MAPDWRRLLAGLALVIALLLGGPLLQQGAASGVATAAAQGFSPAYQAPLGLHRSCGAKIRAAYRAPGCTRRCYPRNFYRQRMDYCVRTGGDV